MEQQSTIVLATVITDLGENNIGSLGPEGRTEQEQVAVSERLAAPEYSQPASNRWICVDGRCSEAEANAPEVDTADPQIAGGVVISETSAELMNPENTKPLSLLTAEKTDEAVADELAVVVHGDEGHGKSGCKANAAQAETLRYGAQNMDIVGPKTWEVCTGLGISQYMRPEDVTDALAAGARSADDPAIMDVSPEEVANIIVDHGGAYVALQGEHGEEDVRADLTDRAFAKAKYVREVNAAELSQKQRQAFSVSLGAYQKSAFERATKHGRDSREAALQVMRVVAYNIALTKLLISNDTKITLVTQA